MSYNLNNHTLVTVTSLPIMGNEQIIYELINQDEEIIGYHIYIGNEWIQIHDNLDDDDGKTTAFPRPKAMANPRPMGQGCVSCVHKRYCDEILYQMDIGVVIDKHSGLACDSWSNNKEDIVRNWTVEDMRKAFHKSMNVDNEEIGFFPPYYKVGD